MESIIISYILASLIIWGLIIFYYNELLEKFKKNKIYVLYFIIFNLFIIFYYEKLYGVKLSKMQKNYIYINSILIIVLSIKLYIDAL